MRKFLSLVSVVGSVVALGLMKIHTSSLILVLVAVGMTGLLNQAVPLLSVVLGVLLVFAAVGAVNIQVNFIQLLL